MSDEPDPHEPTADLHRAMAGGILRQTVMLAGLSSLDIAPVSPIWCEEQRQRVADLEDAFSRLAVALDMPADGVRRTIEREAMESTIVITPQLLTLWTSAVLAGEIGLTEILISLDPDARMCRPKNGKSVMEIGRSAELKPEAPPTERLASAFQDAADAVRRSTWVASHRPREQPAKLRLSKQLSKLGRW